MSYFDATNLPEGVIAQKYTLADNFFHAAFGGSFLNHQFLISVAAPVGNITPIGGMSFTVPGTTFDKTYAVNTVFSANLVPTFSAAGSAALLPSLNDPSDPILPYIPTIGDRLSAKHINWKWYSGGWDLRWPARSAIPPTTASFLRIHPSILKREKSQNRVKW